jgi:hypothetical protein
MTMSRRDSLHIYRRAERRARRAWRYLQSVRWTDKETAAKEAYAEATERVRAADNRPPKWWPNAPQHGSDNGQ